MTTNIILHHVLWFVKPALVEEAILKTEDERLRWEAMLAKNRRHFRNLHAILRKGKARDEEALLAEMEETASTITGLTGRLLDTYRLLGDSYKPPGELPEYYVTGYQDLSLGDHLGIFEPWDHDHFDRQGHYEGTVRGLRGAKCTCNASRKSRIPACPQCGTAWRGEHLLINGKQLTFGISLADLEEALA